MCSGQAISVFAVTAPAPLRSLINQKKKKNAKSYDERFELRKKARMKPADLLTCCTIFDWRCMPLHVTVIYLCANRIYYDCWCSACCLLWEPERPMTSNQWKASCLKTMFHVLWKTHALAVAISQKLACTRASRCCTHIYVYFTFNSRLCVPTSHFVGSFSAKRLERYCGFFDYITANLLSTEQAFIFLFCSTSSKLSTLFLFVWFKAQH